MKRYATSLILASTLIIGEIHTFWERSSPVLHNWILARFVPMTIQWNTKLALEQLNFILYFVAFYLYGFTPNKINRTTVKAFIWFCVIDTAAYFYNWKTFSYYYVYLFLVIIWLTMYFWNTNKRKR